MSAELNLTEAERNSATWLKLRAYLEARIDEHRRMNDNDLSPEKTTMLRGRVNELKHLIATGET